MGAKKYYRKKDIEVLIMVRYLLGTAYLPKKLYKIGYNFFKNFVPTSDYMFFLDASPKEMLKRVDLRDEKEIFENINELKKVRKKALILVKNWNIIDTSDTIEKTFNKIEKILDD